ncbi:hypothetical protein ACTI_56810 [Actinoplanes sp. OR16]|nr:hypothetical protein ACTI_56810 [Actinoplanes sp. OR16]
MAAEIRCGLLNANDTADRETPAAVATSLDVGFLDRMRAPWVGSHDNAARRRSLGVFPDSTGGQREIVRRR